MYTIDQGKEKKEEKEKEKERNENRSTIKERGGGHYSRGKEEPLLRPAPRSRSEDRSRHSSPIPAIIAVDARGINCQSRVDQGTAGNTRDGFSPREDRSIASAIDGARSVVRFFDADPPAYRKLRAEMIKLGN